MLQKVSNEKSENIEKVIHKEKDLSLSLSSIFFNPPPSSFSFRGVLTLEVFKFFSCFLVTIHSLRRDFFFSVGLVARTNHVVEREVKNDARETRSIEIENLELARHAAFENDGYRLARRERVGEISMHTKFTFFFHPSSSSSSRKKKKKKIFVFRSRATFNVTFSSLIPLFFSRRLRRSLSLAFSFFTTHLRVLCGLDY